MVNRVQSGREARYRRHTLWATMRNSIWTGWLTRAPICIAAHVPL
jgi:hypothetical protein